MSNREVVNNMTNDKYLKMVKENWRNLRFIEEQTPEICKVAVEQDGLALQYIKNQTEEISEVAVKQNGMALEFVEKQTPEICVTAVMQNKDALKYVKYNKKIILENVKRMEADSRRQQETGNKMNEEIQKVSDEEIRIREEKALEQMHKETTAAEIKAMETLTRGVVAITTLDKITRETQDNRKEITHKNKKSFFGKIKDLFIKIKVGNKKEISEDEISEKKDSTKNPNMQQTNRTGKVVTDSEREMFSAHMEKILTASEVNRSHPNQTPKKEHVKAKNISDDFTMQR